MGFYREEKEHNLSYGKTKIPFLCAGLPKYGLFPPLPVG